MKRLFIALFFITTISCHTKQKQNMPSIDINSELDKILCKDSLKHRYDSLDKQWYNLVDRYIEISHENVRYLQTNKNLAIRIIRKNLPEMKTILKEQSLILKEQRIIRNQLDSLNKDTIPNNTLILNNGGTQNINTGSGNQTINNP